MAPVHQASGHHLLLEVLQLKDYAVVKPELNVQVLLRVCFRFLGYGELACCSAVLLVFRLDFLVLEEFDQGVSSLLVVGQESVSRRTRLGGVHVGCVGIVIDVLYRRHSVASEHIRLWPRIRERRARGLHLRRRARKLSFSVILSLQVL